LTRQEGVVELMELLEVVGIADPDRRAVVAVAPGHVVAILEPGHAWVVGVDEGLLDLGDAVVGRLPANRLGLDGPVDTIGAAAGVQVHAALRVVDPEDAREPVAERHHGRVEDAVGPLDQVASNDRVAARAPDHGSGPGRTILPRDVGEAHRGRTGCRRRR
jgi:hypothetical protein